MDILQLLRAQAEQVEVIQLRNEATSVEFEANRFKTSKVEETSGVAVRIVRGGRLGFSASSDEHAADRLVSNVLESAAYGDQVSLSFPAPLQAPAVHVFDPAISALPVERLVAIGQEIVDLMLQTDPGVQVNVSLKRSSDETTIRNQAGLEAAFRRSPLSIGVEVARIEGDDVLLLYDMLGTTVWDDNYMAFARRLADQMVLARRLTTMRTARMPVLFSPTGAMTLALPLMEGVDGKNVFNGVSPLCGRIGEKLLDDKITLVDDGTLDGRLGSAPYDDEGVLHRRNVLFDDGVLRGFLYDLKTASQSGVEPTGNGSRGLFQMPRPAPTNMILAGGGTPVAQIIAGIEEGLLVEEVLGLGQGNVISGAFSNPLALAFKIEHGEIVGRVKDLSIAGNVYDLLKDVGAVSKETWWVYGSFCLPYLLLPEINVIAKE